MRFLVVAALISCATTASRVRDPEGNPLPTSARLDADLEPAYVRCGGTEYVIVEPPPPSLLGNHLATHEVHVADPAALCAKIRQRD
jgi:hypothetical protein